MGEITGEDSRRSRIKHSLLDKDGADESDGCIAAMPSTSTIVPQPFADAGHPCLMKLNSEIILGLSKRRFPVVLESRDRKQIQQRKRVSARRTSAAVRPNCTAHFYSA